MTDLQWMARAIELAQCGLYSTRPNPRVGCVIVKDKQVLSEGFHHKAGGDHAEIVALKKLKNPHDAKGATVYVTLEPCSHTGKTPPCCDALVKAGISRVVYGMPDPNPQVNGSGISTLRDAGIRVEGPLLEEECRALNRGFIKRMQIGLPYVRCKLAMSLDGRSAMASGESQWITGEVAREDVQQLRALSCAIITGVATILHDDPALTVRSAKLPAAAKEQQPLRVILDRNGRVPDKANIFRQPGETLVIRNSNNLKTVLMTLADKQCNDVLIEAGATLAGAFVQQGLVDELIVYMAPTLLGSKARPLLQLPFDKMNQKINLSISDIRAMGNDWRITAIPLHTQGGS
jgi:diaminohydroxyphosphoribosylaminopyrimidine deaminase / 5-amino-6-(5-phosphoribosylamino)uracil reductase